jgi:outer membrane cobalamin receptor
MLLGALPLQAGEGTGPGESRPDSARVYRFGEIVVTAERYPVSARNAGAVSYDAARIGRTPFTSVGEALAPLRNLHLMSYGGGMSLQTLSVRGMGAEHTLLLWNGMPAGNMQTGIADLAMVDASAVGAVQVVPGGAAALHGSSAVGGVVNLVPRIPYGGSRSAEVSAGAGSFGATGLALGAEASPDSTVGISIRAGSRRSKWEYPFAAAGGEHLRENADFLGRTLTVSAGWRNSGSGRIGVFASAVSLRQGAPGPWYEGAIPSVARREDTRTLAGLSVEQYPSDELSLTAAGLFDAQYERYLDPGPFFPADNYYRTARAAVTGQARYRASRSWLFHAGADFALSRVAGNAIDRTRTRRTAALTASASWETLLGGEGGGITARLTQSGRIEGNTSFTPCLSPKLGLNLEWSSGGSSARLHATAGTGRRNPTMNELYFSGEGGRGNPGLRDERSVSLDAGIGALVPILGGISCDVTWFRIRMADRILWAPTDDPWIWRPDNVGRSLSTGWELSAAWALLPGQVELTGDYSITDAKRGELTADGTIEYTDHLVYVPLNKGSVGLFLGRRNIARWPVSLSLEVRLIHTGERYTLGDNSVSLPAYRTVDAEAAVEFPAPGGTVTVSYAPRNLGDVDYQVLPGYPMPRFHHNAAIAYSVRY